MENQDNNTTLTPEEEIARLRKRVAELERQEMTREKLQDFLRDGPGCQAVTGYSSKDYLENPGLWF